MTCQFHSGVPRVLLGVLVPVQVRGECGLGWGAGSKDAEAGCVGTGIRGEDGRSYWQVDLIDRERVTQHRSQDLVPLTRMWRTWGALASGRLCSWPRVPGTNY